MLTCFRWKERHNRRSFMGVSTQQRRRDRFRRVLVEQAQGTPTTSSSVLLLVDRGLDRNYES